MKNIILAYVVARKLFTVTPDDAKRLTHVNIAFGLVNEDCTLNTCQLDDIGYIETIRKWNPDIKIVLSVGGWGAGNFSEMAMTEKGRKIFAASCAEYAEKVGLDGIDIDWEYPCNDSAGIGCDPKDKENFTCLLQELRNALGKDKIVSIAAGAGAYFVRDTEMDKVAEICDYVQLMTYDMRSGFCPEAGHHAALYTSKGDTMNANTDYTVKMFNKAGVPMEKIVIGAAFYARSWDGVPNEDNGLFKPAKTLGGYGANYSKLVHEFIDKNGYTKYYDEEAKAHYLFNGSNFISYESPEAISEKAKYVKEKGLLGIMYWEHSCDETHSLLKIMADELQ